MTISSTTRISPVYIGAGTNATFAFPFKVFSASDIEVVQVVVSTGALTTLTLTTDYTVALNGNQNTNPGGSITLVAGNLPTGTNLVITSNVLNLQPTDLTNQGGFYPEVINDSLDRATIQIQQLNDTAQNAVHAPVTDGALAMTLPSAGIRANKFLAFGATGLPVAANGTTNPAITSGGDITLTANDAGSNVNRDVIFVDNTTERMRLTGSNGRLGIGTATPAVALDVVGAAAVSGNMTVTGAAAVSGNLTVDTTTLVVDATNNRVGISNATPAVALDVTGAASVSGNLTVDTTTLVVDAANNRVGIANATPAVALDVTGAASVSGNLTVDTTTLVVDSTNNRVGVGVTPATNYQLHVKSQSTGTSAAALVVENSAPSGLLVVRDDGRIATGTAATSPTNNTTGSAANVFVDASGILFKSSSALKYKTDVTNMQHGLASVLSLRPVTFRGLNDGDKVFGGFIAEEVAAAGLEEFVVRNAAGEPDAIHYANMVALMAKAIQQLEARVAALEAGA
jgi:hypothetical protein